ncbi:MAG: ATP-binding cassette domain-containing protein [Opitutaceae bacterium]|nr:ATP-binding cassette domain-containing protein [Cytophagales bacterium]
MVHAQAVSLLHKAFIKHYIVKEDTKALLNIENRYKMVPDLSPAAFLDALVDSGGSLNLIYLSYVVSDQNLKKTIIDSTFPFIVFENNHNNEWKPVFVSKEKNGNPFYINSINEKIYLKDIDAWIIKLADRHDIIKETDDRSGKLVITAFPKEITYSATDENNTNPPFDPVKRFFKFLNNEKEAIGYIYAYSIFASIVSLSLPLGVQAIIGFVSNQQMNTSVTVLIALIVLGSLVHGALQLMQINLVEHIQQRIFARTAFEFAYRIPRLKMKELKGNYAPEIVNRFFEVVSLQKGVSSILVDFTVAIVQIVLGLLLLSFYHISFIAFGVVVLVVLFAIIRLTSYKGLKTSLYESKYKYKLAYWLQEIARSISTFKLAGYSNLPMQKTDHYLINYLHSRQDHFRVLSVQYTTFIFFKTFVTGGLLVLGCMLILNEQINLGQFIASEIVIIMIMAAIEKIILKIDVVYDVLTGIEKIGAVMDLPVETPTGITIESLSDGEGFSIEARELRFKFQNEEIYALNRINFNIETGEKICFSGFSGSGKTTLANVLIGYYPAYEGALNINNIPIRNLNINSFISHVGDNISQEDVFHGTILENITLGKSNISISSVLWALEIAGLRETVNKLKEGINTELSGENNDFHQDFTQRIILARAICKRPKLLVIDIESLNFDKRQTEKMLAKILDIKRAWTVVFLSNDPLVMQKCDRTIILDKGESLFEDTFESLKNAGHLTNLI